MQKKVKSKEKKFFRVCIIILILGTAISLLPLLAQGLEAGAAPAPLPAAGSSPEPTAAPAAAPVFDTWCMEAVELPASGETAGDNADAAAEVDTAEADAAEESSGTAGNEEIAGTAETDKPAAAPNPVPAPVPSPVTAACSSESSQTADNTEPSLAVSAPPQPVKAVQPSAVAGKELVRNLQVKVKVTNQGTTPSNNIRMEIPLLAKLDSPYQLLLEERFSHQPSQLSGREMGGRTMLVEIPSLDPGASETITLNYVLAAQRPAAAGSPAADLSQYLLPSPKVESDHAEIMATAARITSDIAGDYEKARAIYSFVIGQMTYTLDASNRNQGAISALNSRQGVCEDYASLFVALCRAAGIPARVVNGYADPKGTGQIWNLSPGQSIALNRYRHAWVECYVEGRGWLPADPTFEAGPNSFNYFGSLPHGSHIAQNYLDLSLRARFQGGKLAVTWDETLVSS